MQWVEALPGNYKATQEIVDKSLLVKFHKACPVKQQATCGCLIGHQNFTNYYRELDIKNAIATTRFTCNPLSE